MDFNMNDWVYFSNGLPMVPVTEVIVNETNGTIKAATFGRGIWQSDLYSDCGPFLFLSGYAQGNLFYQSGGFIETTQVLPASYGNLLRLRSPTKITLKPGFRALTNSYVRAIIGNCGQGVMSRGVDDPEKAMSKTENLRQIEREKNNKEDQQ